MLFHIWLFRMLSFSSCCGFAQLNWHSLAQLLALRFFFTNFFDLEIKVVVGRGFQPPILWRPSSFFQKVMNFNDIWHIMWIFAGTMIFNTSHTTNTHTQRHTCLETNTLVHPYKYILTSPVTYSQQLSVLYWMNNSMISKYLLSTLSFLFKNNSLTEVVYLLIRWESGLVG